MRRRRRTTILVNGDPNLAGRLAGTIRQNHDCKEIIAPHYGMTMIKTRESARKSLFYLGEVLVTEAKVEINDCVGIGIVNGMQDQLAKDLAVIDAAYQANLNETVEWNDVLLAEERDITRKRAELQSELMNTKVNFETMTE